MGDEILSLDKSRVEILRKTAHFLHHRDKLFRLWETLAERNDDTYESSSLVETITSMDIVCRGFPKKYDPNFRQRNASGECVQNLKQLYECANTMKQSFDNVLKKIAAQNSLSFREWDGRSILTAETGLIICPLKSIDRATDKIREKYMKIEPGPPEAWLYDVLRACYVCETEDQMQNIFERIQNFPSFEVIRVKNRFLTPHPSGFRDLQLSVRMMVKDSLGHLISFICEVTITHIDIKQYEYEHNTYLLYTFLRSLFVSNSAVRQESIIKLLNELVATINVPIDSTPSKYVDSNLDFVISDTLSSQCDKVVISDDIENLETWIDLLKFMNEHELCEKLQRKVLKVLVLAKGEDNPEVADALDALAVTLKVQEKYPQAFSLYEKSVYVRTRLFGERHPLVANALHSLAGVLYLQRKYSMAMPIHEQVLFIRRQIYGSEHPEVAASLNNLAGLLEAQGQFEQAKTYYKQAIEVWVAVYGDMHPYVAASINNLALLLDSTNQVKEAKLLFEQALAIRIQLYGENHIQVAGSLNNLALSFKKLGMFDAAKPLYERSLIIRKKQLGEKHPSVATTLNNLGLLLKKQKKYDEAKPLYLEALAIRKEVFGHDHADVAASLNNLALLCDATGNYNESLVAHEEALEIRSKVFGPEHKSVAETLFNMGQVIQKLKDLPRAKLTFERALKIRTLYSEDSNEVRQIKAAIAAINEQLSAQVAADTEERPTTKHDGLFADEVRSSNSPDEIHLRVVGQEHFLLALSLRGTAQNLISEGKIEESKPLLEQSLALMKVVYDTEHEQIATSQMLLGNVLKSLGRVSEAVKLYQDAVMNLRVVYGSAHANVIKVLITLAGILVMQRNFDSAKAVLEEALKLSQQLYGEENIEVSNVLSEYANVCKADGDYTNAKKLHEKCLSMRIKLCGENHPNVALSLSDLGLLMQAMEQYNEAINLHKQALSMRLKAYGGENNKEVALSYRLLGVTYKEQGRWLHAKENLEKAASVFTVVQGEDDPLLAATLNDLAIVLIFVNSEGNLDIAIPMFEKALDIRLKCYGRMHHETAETMHDLALVLKTYPRTSPHERALAILFFEDALKIRRSLFAEEDDHPDIVDTLQELATLLLEEHVWEQAKPYHLELLAIRRREFPDEDSIFLAQTLQNCALILLRCNEIWEAKDLANEALEMWRRLHNESPVPIQLSDVMMLYAEVREAEGKYNKAKALYEDALVLRSDFYGEEDPSVAECYECIAHLRVKTDKLEKARDLLLKALRIRRFCANDNATPEICFTLSDMVEIMILLGKMEEAKPLCEETVRVSKLVHRNDSHHIADVMMQLARILCALNEWEASKDVLKDALALRKYWFDPYSGKIAEVYSLLGNVYRELGLVNEAAEIFASNVTINIRNSHGQDTSEILYGFVDIGMLYMDAQRFEDAIPFISHSVEMAIRMNGMMHADVGSCLAKLAFCYRKLNKFEDARLRYEQSVSIFRKLFGTMHVEIANSLAGLSSLAFYQRNYEDALLFINQVLYIRKKLVGTFHEDYVSALFNQATIFEKLGQFKKALINVQTVLKWSMISLSSNDTGLSDCYIKLAFLHRKLGHFDDALQFNDKAISILIKNSDAMHLDVMDREAFAAEIYRLRGQLKEAERLLRKVYNRYLEELGKDDPTTMKYTFDLASLLKKVCKIQEAETLFKQLLVSQKDFYGIDSPLVATTLNCLGVMYTDQCKYSQALEMLNDALKIRRFAFGEDHCDVASTLNNIAALYESQGKFKEAKQRYEQSVQVRCTVFGKSHPAVAQSLNNLASLYCIMGQPQDSEVLLEDALRIYRDAFGESHPEYISALNNLAGCYEGQGKHKDASKLYEQCLQSRKAIYGMSHPLVALSFNNLATSKFREAKYSEAGPLYEQAMEIRVKLYGEENILIAESWNNLAMLHLASGKLNAALSAQQKAVNLVEQLVGPGHPNTVNLRGNLGICYKRMGEREKGLSLLEAAVKFLEKKKYPASHPWVKKFSSELVDYTAIDINNTSLDSSNLNTSSNLNASSILSTGGVPNDRIYSEGSRERDNSIAISTSEKSTVDKSSEWSIRPRGPGSDMTTTSSQVSFRAPLGQSQLTPPGSKKSLQPQASKRIFIPLPQDFEESMDASLLRQGSDRFDYRRDESGEVDIGDIKIDSTDEFNDLDMIHVDVTDISTPDQTLGEGQERVKLPASFVKRQTEKMGSMTPKSRLKKVRSIREANTVSIQDKTTKKEASQKIKTGPSSPVRPKGAKSNSGLTPVPSRSDGSDGTQESERLYESGSVSSIDRSESESTSDRVKSRSESEYESIGSSQHTRRSSKASLEASNSDDDPESDVN